MKISLVSQLIAEAHEGLDEIASVELSRITEAVDAGHGDGELVIKIKVQRDPSGALVLTPQIKGKAPNRGAPRAMLFRDPDGSLTTEDPRQMTMGAVVAFSSKKGGN